MRRLRQRQGSRTGHRPDAENGFDDLLAHAFLSAASAPDWKTSPAAEGIEVGGRGPKASRWQREFYQVREVALIHQAGDLAFSGVSSPPILFRLPLRAFQAPWFCRAAAFATAPWDSSRQARMLSFAVNLGRISPIGLVASVGVCPLGSLAAGKLSRRLLPFLRAPADVAIVNKCKHLSAVEGTASGRYDARNFSANPRGRTARVAFSRDTRTEYSAKVHNFCARRRSNSARHDALKSRSKSNDPS